MADPEKPNDDVEQSAMQRIRAPLGDASTSKPMLRKASPWVCFGLGAVLLVTAILIPLRANSHSESVTTTAKSLDGTAPEPSKPVMNYSPGGTPTAETPINKTTEMPTPSPLGVKQAATPTTGPSRSPRHSQAPTATPTYYINPTRPVTFFPGILNVSMEGLLLSQGLSAKLIAKSGHHVNFTNGEKSEDPFHWQPDFGATFEDPSNPGGWIYVSNSENKNKTKGGVGAITFDSEGNVVDYKMVLNGTWANCAGGKTPWNSWISCEERRLGRIWEVDPTGVRPGRPITLGSEGGFFESFAYDIRNNHFFVTEDALAGPLRRFTPTNPDWNDPWDVLHGNGTTEYLILEPSSEYEYSGTYRWTFNKTEAVATVQATYPRSEGINVYRNHLHFVCKANKTMFTLDLDGNTYFGQYTMVGLFDGQPDQIVNLVGSREEVLYFTEDEGKYAGIHVRNGRGEFYTVLESHEYSPETTGLAFSPDFKHMYFAFQTSGVLFDVTRDDGYPFGAKVFNISFPEQ